MGLNPTRTHWIRHFWIESARSAVNKWWSKSISLSTWSQKSTARSKRSKSGTATRREVGFELTFDGDSTHELASTGAGGSKVGRDGFSRLDDPV
jgi:ribosomal protein L16/L10AE